MVGEEVVVVAVHVSHSSDGGVGGGAIVAKVVGEKWRQVEEAIGCRSRGVKVVVVVVVVVVEIGELHEAMELVLVLKVVVVLVRLFLHEEGGGVGRGGEVGGCHLRWRRRWWSD